MRLYGKQAWTICSPTLWVLIPATSPRPREHMAKWLGGESTITKEMRDEIRDLNADTSQTVFAGERVNPLVCSFIYPYRALLTQGMTGMPGIISLWHNQLLE